MKPWPAALAALCPLPPGVWEERPWWRRDPTDLLYMFRCDDKCAENIEGAREVDAIRPLVHPGFRAGQVWADAEGITLVITRVAGGVPWFENGVGSGYIGDYPYLVSDPCCPHLAPWAPPETP